MLTSIQCKVLPHPILKETEITVKSLGRKYSHLLPRASRGLGMATEFGGVNFNWVVAVAGEFGKAVWIALLEVGVSCSGGITAKDTGVARLVVVVEAGTAHSAHGGVAVVVHGRHAGVIRHGLVLLLNRGGGGGGSCCSGLMLLRLLAAADEEEEETDEGKGTNGSDDDSSDGASRKTGVLFSTRVLILGARDPSVLLFPFSRNRLVNLKSVLLFLREFYLLFDISGTISPGTILDSSRTISSCIGRCLTD